MPPLVWRKKIKKIPTQKNLQRRTCPIRLRGNFWASSTALACEEGGPRVAIKTRTLQLTHGSSANYAVCCMNYNMLFRHSKICKCRFVRFPDSRGV